MGAPRFPTCAWTVTGRLDGRGPRLWRRGRVVHRPFGTNGPVSRLRGRLSTLSTPPTGNTERFSLFLLSLNRDVLVTGGRRAGAPLEPPSGRGSSSPIAMAAKARQPHLCGRARLRLPRSPAPSPLARADGRRCPLGSGSRTSQPGLPGPPSPPDPLSHGDGRGGSMCSGEGQALPAPPGCRGAAASQPIPPPVSPRDGGRGAGDSGGTIFPQTPGWPPRGRFPKDASPRHLVAARRALLAGPFVRRCRERGRASLAGGALPSIPDP